jgi:hypothetical protein
MCTRAIGISCLIFICLSVNAQSDFHFNAKVYPIFSFFGVNKKASGYDKALDNADLGFKGKAGFGAGLGAEYDFSERITGFVDFRYNYWGGNIQIKDPSDPLGSVDINVTYHSINIPIGLRYYFMNKDKYRLSVSAGGGIDHTVSETFVPTNYYGKFDPIKKNTDISTRYLLLGVGVEYKVSNKLIGILGLEVNNDMLLNPNRMQDIGGYYAVQMPLKYNLIALTIGIKI